jgi:AcrR family transcriptional regulator
MKSTDTTATAGSIDRPYHHGDLATALLDAAECELTEKGVEGFSLRGVAKRAGVSHAAPAHHFHDVNDLLSTLAARGFERLMARQLAVRRQCDPRPRVQLGASALGYIAFAVENPALFRLMFGSQRPDFTSEQLARVARAAFDDLVTQVTNATGNPNPPAKDHAALVDVAAVWAAAHGLADLLSAGRLPALRELPEAIRNDAVRKIMERTLDAFAEG